jgi:hypothetical protein
MELDCKNSGIGSKRAKNMRKTVSLFVTMSLLLALSQAKAGYVLKAYESNGTTLYNGRSLGINDILKLTITATDGDAGDLPFFVVVAEKDLADISGGVMNIPPAPDFSMIFDGSASANMVADLGNQDGILGSVAGLAFPPYDNGVYVTDIQYQCKGNGNVLVSFLVLDANNFSADPQMGAILLDSLTIYQGASVSSHNIVVYRIWGNMSGFVFDPDSQLQTVMGVNERPRGYIVADVNATTLCTRYSSTPDTNDPTLIVIDNESFAVLRGTDPNIIATFDLAQSGDKYHQKFAVLRKNGRRAENTMVRPQINFVYDNNSTDGHMAFYSDDLVGNLHSLNIGTAAKMSVPKFIKGHTYFDLSTDQLTSGKVLLTLDKEYTKLANKGGMSVADTVTALTNDLQKRYSEVSVANFAAQ